MKTLIFLSLLLLTSTADFTYERLTPENSALLLVDHQTGLFNGVADQSLPDFKNNVMALVDAAKMFKIPVILSTSFQNGPNGPLIPEILEAFPDAPLIQRPGQINAWDNEDFVKAVNETGRKKLIIAGDFCSSFCKSSRI